MGTINDMESALLIHRLQFAFTVTYHYLFPQLDHGTGAVDRDSEDSGVNSAKVAGTDTDEDLIV